MKSEELFDIIIRNIDNLGIILTIEQELEIKSLCSDIDKPEEVLESFSNSHPHIISKKKHR